MYANFTTRSHADACSSADFDPQPLDGASASNVLQAINKNTQLARSLLDHLNSDDPGCSGLPANRRDQLRSLCMDVIHHRSFHPGGGARAMHPPSGMPPGVPLPVTERHCVMAQKDRVGLDDMMKELATESRRQLERSLAPLRQDLQEIESRCQSLLPPLRLPFCAKVNHVLNNLSHVSEDDVRTLPVGTTVRIALEACASFKRHLEAVRTLGSLQQDLNLGKASNSPGAAFNAIKWIEACDALQREHWDLLQDRITALSRLREPAPVLARRPTPPLP